MLAKTSLGKRSALLVLLAFGVLLGAAWAQKERVLYSFCAQSGCVDGKLPQAGLVFDQKGNLYGMTASGGGGLYNQGCFDSTCGVVFKLTPDGKETVLYSFCSQSGCTDGANPIAALVLDQEGNLYGTTFFGGAYGYGAVFKLTPKGRYTVLHSFCARTNCVDGEFPAAGLVVDRKGNLYGTTHYGGGPHENCSAGCGVVFKVTPKGKETVLYSFCAQANCADGELPIAGLVFDQKGNLYGTTVQGGSNSTDCVIGCGVVFKLTPEGKETVIYSFCGQTNCVDGAEPYAGLVLDQKGNLYGTTIEGGAYGVGGVVFKLTPKGKETVLYTFCAETNCTDGEGPTAGLVFDQKGNLYGTTQNGGAPRESGVVFKLTPEGKETVLYSFCWRDNCTDGESPMAGVVFDLKGNLYGTTYHGGAYGGAYGDAGVVFKLTP
jgi:uncharacterized repeat protein (TIGR03803 family)